MDVYVTDLYVMELYILSGTEFLVHSFTKILNYVHISFQTDTTAQSLLILW